MTGDTGAQASHLEPKASELHAPAYREAHVDSEERVQYERQRVSRELLPVPITVPSVPSSESSNVQHARPSFGSLRSRDVSFRQTAGSQEYLQGQAYDESETSTQADTPRASEHDERSSIGVPHWFDPITKFWKAHISMTIDEGAHRDHLALERTFLGYLRTSLVFVMTGVLIAQLFRLQRTANPDPDFGFYIIGKPLSIIFISMALVVIIFGAFRFWKLQQGLIKGRAHAGGWEVLLIMGLSILVLLGTFALVLGVDIDKSYFGQSRN